VKRFVQTQAFEGILRENKYFGKVMEGSCNRYPVHRAQLLECPNPQDPPRDFSMPQGFLEVIKSLHTYTPKKLKTKKVLEKI